MTVLDLAQLKGAVGIVGDSLLTGQLRTRLEEAGVDLPPVIPVAGDRTSLIRTRVVLAAVSGGEELLSLVLNAPFSTGAMAGAMVYVVSPASPISVKAAAQLAQMHGVRLATAVLSEDTPSVLFCNAPADAARYGLSAPFALEAAG